MTTRAIQTIQNGLETTHQDAVSATGNGTAATVNGFGSITFQITGTFSATVTFEASVDGTNYETIAVIDSDGDRVTSATSTGLYRADIAGYKYVRTPVTWTSGTSVTVKSLALPGQRSFDVPVQQYGSIVASKKAVRSGAINTATSEEILNVQKEIYIDEFVINFGAVSNVDLRLRIDFFDGNAFQPYELTDGGVAYTTSRIYESTAKYSGYFEIINAASPLIIGLKKDYIHKKGIKVQLLNDTGASQDVYVSIQYSEGE